MAPSASAGASIWPAFATTMALSHCPAAMSAAERRKRIRGFLGCWVAWALRVGISAGVTGLSRGPPAPPPPAQATARTLLPKSRDLRPANVGDSRQEGGLSYWCLTGTAMTRVTGAPRRGANAQRPATARPTDERQKREAAGTAQGRTVA